MRGLAALGLYRPGWSTPDGKRASGPDEDLISLAVAACQAALGKASADHVMLISAEPAGMDGPVAAVLLAALRLPMHTPVEVRVGGSPAVCAALGSAAPGTLVVAVSQTGGSGAAAALVGHEGEGGLQVKIGNRIEHGVPSGPANLVDDDPRFFRDRAWKPAVDRLSERPDGSALLVAGLAPDVAVRLGSDRALSRDVDVTGAAACLFAVAALSASGRAGRVICLDGGSAAALDVSGCTERLVRVQRAQLLPLPADALAGDIPISLSAYERAFDAKVGLQAGCCECGELSLPPRDVCLNCGRERCWRLQPLSHDARVYSVTTVRAPIPGMRSPYSLAVAEIDDVGVRLLAPVTDAVAGTTRIGQTGRLVLRRLSMREGVADYGYAFQPNDDAALAANDGAVA